MVDEGIRVWMVGRGRELVGRVEGLHGLRTRRKGSRRRRRVRARRIGLVHLLLLLHLLSVHSTLSDLPYHPPIHPLPILQRHPTSSPRLQQPPSSPSPLQLPPPHPLPIPTKPFLQPIAPQPWQALLPPPLPRPHVHQPISLSHHPSQPFLLSPRRQQVPTASPSTTNVLSLPLPPHDSTTISHRSNPPPPLQPNNLPLHPPSPPRTPITIISQQTTNPLSPDSRLKLPLPTILPPLTSPRREAHPLGGTRTRMTSNSPNRSFISRQPTRRPFLLHRDLGERRRWRIRTFLLSIWTATTTINRWRRGTRLWLR